MWCVQGTPGDLGGVTQSVTLGISEAPSPVPPSRRGLALPREESPMPDTHVEVGQATDPSGSRVVLLQVPGERVFLDPREAYDLAATIVHAAREVRDLASC